MNGKIGGNRVKKKSFLLFRANNIDYTHYTDRMFITKQVLKFEASNQFYEWRLIRLSLFPPGCLAAIFVHRPRSFANEPRSRGFTPARLKQLDRENYSGEVQPERALRAERVPNVLILSSLRALPASKTRNIARANCLIRAGNAEKRDGVCKRRKIKEKNK